MMKYYFDISICFLIYISLLITANIITPHKEDKRSHFKVYWESSNGCVQNNILLTDQIGMIEIHLQTGYIVRKYLNMIGLTFPRKDS